MIKNNKHPPNTLYLLNSKVKFQEEKKSARPSFNQKKTTRSISQFSKWGKQTSPFKQSKDNSSLKKIILNKKNYSMEPIDIGKKISQISKIFQEQNFQRNSKNSSNASRTLQSGEKDLSNLKILKNQQSLLNVQYQQTIQTVVAKVNKKFKKYYLMTEDWRQKYIYEEIDSILDELISNFKQLFSEVCSIYNRQIISNIQFFENQIVSVAKDYQVQIETLKKQLNEKDAQKETTKSMLLQIDQLRKRGVLNSKILSQLSSQGIDIQNWIKSSHTFQEHLNSLNILNNAQHFKQRYSESQLIHKQQFKKMKKEPYQYEYQKVNGQSKISKKNDSSLNINIGNIWKKQGKSNNELHYNDYYKKLNSYR